MREGLVRLQHDSYRKWAAYMSKGSNYFEASFYTIFGWMVCKITYLSGKIDW